MARASDNPTAVDRQGWLFGPALDLILGCGLGSLAILAFQGGSGGALDRWISPGLLIFLFAVPHYGATLVRVYEPDVDRRRYRFVAFHASALLAALFVAGLHWPALGSLILTVYLAWSPWHYTGQNYGITLMMLGRRGVALGSAAKRTLYASFMASYLLTLIAIVGPRETGAFAPVSYAGSIYEQLRLGVPLELAALATSLVTATYVGCLATSVVLLLRRGSLRAVAPALILVVTQASWFAVPVMVRHFGIQAGIDAFSSTYTAVGFIWIAAAHSLQYLWITTYYATGPRASARVHARFLGKAVLSGFLIWTLPALVFAPHYLGSLPHESGLAVMAAAVVNLHHFILDGVIWKLRDGRVARILLRGAGEASEAPAVHTRPRWIRRGVWALGVISLACSLAAWWEGDRRFVQALEQGDWTSARSALTRLGWLGADGPRRHVLLGRSLARNGNEEAAMVEFEESLRLHPTPLAWTSIGKLQEQRGHWGPAALAYTEASEATPGDAQSLYRAGRAWLRAGEPARAVAPLEQAAVLVPDDKLLMLTLARARREAEAAD